MLFTSPSGVVFEASDVELFILLGIGEVPSEPSLANSVEYLKSVGFLITSPYDKGEQPLLSK